MRWPSRNDIRPWIANRSARRVTVGVVILVLLLAVLAVVGIYVYFGVFAHHAPAEVHAAVLADESVTVTEAYGGYVVSPATGAAEVGIVFYPGGRVAPAAYLPTAAQIAERAAVTVVVPKMRVNLAVLSPGRADAVIAGETAVSTWVVGGHSLGGAMACRYAADNPDAVDGLVLVGAYCDRPVRDRPALIVLGTRDVVLDRERFAANRENLPADRSVRHVTGMNHSQAGWYSGQRESQPARVATTEAHRRLAIAVSNWLCDAYDHCPPHGDVSVDANVYE